MEVKVTEQSPIASQVHVEVDAARVEAGVSKRLKQLAGQVKIAGFRKGKVPSRELERRYGKGARYEAIDDIVRSAMDEVMRRDDLRGSIHIGRPELVSGLEGPGGITFTFIAERLPNIEATNYKGVAVEQVRVVVSDDEVQAELEKLQAEHTTDVPVEDREEIAATDVVICSYRGVGEGPAAEIFADDQTIWLADENLLAGFADNVAGHKRGEEVQVQVTLPEDFQLEELAGQTITLEVTVSEIKERRTPAIDDELAAETGLADTLDDLKASIIARISAERTAATEGDAKNRLVEALRAAHEVTLPPGFVEAQCVDEVRQRLRMMQQQGIDPTTLQLDVERLKDAVRPQVERGMQASVVLRSISDKESIDATDADVEAHIEKLASDRNMPLARVKAQFANEDARISLRAQLTHEMVMKFLWDAANVTMVDALTETEPAESEAAAEASGADE